MGQWERDQGRGVELRIRTEADPRVNIEAEVGNIAIRTYKIVRKCFKDEVNFLEEIKF